RLTISDDTRDLPGAFGGGCAALLEGIADEGSLNRAAKRMGMAYSKAWRIVREAEAHLDCELLTRDGARGSRLTPEGERALKGYRELQREVDELIARRLRELLP
ncbi:MAG: LysR family transcriptional regulator, partial [Collinsella stercoris]|nr:LysR family transcriptional regulator [Collinsella stercoris]